MKKTSMALAALTAVLILGGPAFAQQGPTNLGPLVNSAGSDFGPIVTASGNALYFTSDREGGFGEQDIWMSRRIGGEWTKAENLGAGINTKYSEGPDSFSVDEKTMFFTRCDKMQDKGICDIYTASWDDAKNQWGEARSLGSGVNSNYNDANASLSHDGKTLYFVSDRPAGDEEARNWDIFVSHKTGGEWGPAVRLGEPVNTSGSEIHVIIHQDNETLYFSSDGHGGFGGTDIFYSKIENGKFGDPVNMGDKINTPRNDIYFTIPASGDLAYLASNRSGGFGMEDIYSVPLGLLSSEPETGVVILKGLIVDRSSCAAPEQGESGVDVSTCTPVANAVLSVSRVGGKNTIVEKTTDSSGTFSATLNNGKGFTVTVKAEGYKTTSHGLEPEQGKPFQVIEKNFMLTPR